MGKYEIRDDYKLLPLKLIKRERKIHGRKILSVIVQHYHAFSKFTNLQSLPLSKYNTKRFRANLEIIYTRNALSNFILPEEYLSLNWKRKLESIVRRGNGKLLSPLLSRALSPEK